MADNDVGLGGIGKSYNELTATGNSQIRAKVGLITIFCLCNG
jgi:hypothetical protein